MWSILLGYRSMDLPRRLPLADKKPELNPSSLQPANRGYRKHLEERAAGKGTLLREERVWGCRAGEGPSA